MNSCDGNKSTCYFYMNELQEKKKDKINFNRDTTKAIKGCQSKTRKIDGSATVGLS